MTNETGFVIALTVLRRVETALTLAVQHAPCLTSLAVSQADLFNVQETISVLEGIRDVMHDAVAVPSLN